MQEAEPMCLTLGVALLVFTLEIAEEEYLLKRISAISGEGPTRS
jgi:hypothetical protein